MDAKSSAEVAIKTIEKERIENQFELFCKKIIEMKNKLCIDDPIVERKKKAPKMLESVHGYSASEEYHSNNVKNSFLKVYYKAYAFVIAAIKKRFDQPDYEMYVAMQNFLVMSCNGKDPQQKINRSVNGDISFVSLYSEDIDMNS